MGAPCGAGVARVGRNDGVVCSEAAWRCGTGLSPPEVPGAHAGGTRKNRASRANSAAEGRSSGRQAHVARTSSTKPSKRETSARGGNFVCKKLRSSRASFNRRHSEARRGPKSQSSGGGPKRQSAVRHWEPSPMPIEVVHSGLQPLSPAARGHEATPASNEDRGGLCRRRLDLPRRHDSRCRHAHVCGARSFLCAA